jgi:hypothetical protein
LLLGSTCAGLRGAKIRPRAWGLALIRYFCEEAGSGLTFSMNVSPTIILKAIILAKGERLAMCGFNTMQNFRMEMNANPTDALLTMPSFFNYSAKDIKHRELKTYPEMCKPERLRRRRVFRVDTDSLSYHCCHSYEEGHDR